MNLSFTILSSLFISINNKQQEEKIWVFWNEANFFILLKMLSIGISYYLNICYRQSRSIIAITIYVEYSLLGNFPLFMATLQNIYLMTLSNSWKKTQIYLGTSYGVLYTWLLVAMSHVLQVVVIMQAWLL